MRGIICAIQINTHLYNFGRIPLLGSGSDFAPFIKKIGVTCADLRYHFDDKLGISSYPLYHSVYETFHLVDKIMDPTFAVSCIIAQLMFCVPRLSA